MIMKEGDGGWLYDDKAYKISTNGNSFKIKNSK